MMGITYGDYLIDSGYYDPTPEQERERELDCPICNGDCSAIPGGPPYNCPTYCSMDVAWICDDERYPFVMGIVTTNTETVAAWAESGIKFTPLVRRYALTCSSERTEVTDDMVDRAMTRFQDAVNSMVMCKRCNGTGYHHGFGEHGHDPDWCEVCGGCQSVPEFEDKAAMREALIAAVSGSTEGGK